MSATDAAFQNNIYRSDITELIISNKEMNDVMKIVKWLNELGLLIKGASKTIENEAKEQSGYLSILLATVVTSLLENILVGKTKIPEQRVIRAGEGTIRAGQDFKCRLILESIWNTTILSKNPKFNGIYSRNYLLKIKDGAYVINLVEYNLVGTNGVALYVSGDNVEHFDSFGVEHILKEI